MSAAKIDRILDRTIYSVVWVHRVTGDICLDGDRKFIDMSRSLAIEACQCGNVLRVYEINLIEETVRNVTDELMLAAGMIEEAA
ncbi:hypothetical protein LJR231_003496 [Phyllobacterium sp. LjRoot231]|uniref:hypothetical protein n=1 Tax=Phyllobacterium sp. LjRoot231 TaxID=3342289 RepID=UPI003ECF398F